MLAAYCASKGAVVSLTRQIALDYGKNKIHANAILPGGGSFSFRYIYKGSSGHELQASKLHCLTPL